MSKVGLREVVALGALGVAAFIGFMFLDPTSTESTSHTPGDIRLGATPPTATPTLGPTATPVPVTRLAQPESWRLTYYEAAVSGGDILTGDSFVRRLDLVSERAPFRDMRDDAWSAVLSQQVDAAAGRNAFTLEYDCAVTVFVDDEEVARGEDPDGPARLEVTFDHAGGEAALRVEARDTGGPFLLRWVD
ncbi:MAG: hypothetical protein KJ048_17465 [Dehalococcoidia bacterium]|nr:hypothetical protein [Dehalococcoidia bacterium]